MSTPARSKRAPLIQQSPFEKLARSTGETGNDDLKEARQIALEKIVTNQLQPRSYFNDERLQELAQDIEARGILQPLIVRKIEGDRYEIVAGERRYRAAKLANLKSVPVLVRDLDDEQAEITSLIENIQRENLNLSDEVRYFHMLKTKYDYSIREIAEEVHKSAGYVDVRLKLAENQAVLKLVETDQVGLQKANELVRMAAPELEKELKRIESLPKNSQSVFSKDTLPKNSQSKTEKTAQQRATQLAKPFCDHRTRDRKGRRTLPGGRSRRTPCAAGRRGETRERAGYP